MNRGKGKSKPTLGDSASDFMAQWKASRTEEPSVVIEPDRGTNGGGRNVEQTLRSWKRGGGEVKVTKGTSTGYAKRKKKPSDPPPDKKPAVTAAGIGAIKPEKPRIPQSVLAPKSLRQRLLEASADVHDLRIAAAMSRPRGVFELDSVVEDEEESSPSLGWTSGQLLPRPWCAGLAVIMPSTGPMQSRAKTTTS